MLGIRYETWRDVCDMYFSLGTGSQKSYLQWFSFTKLSSSDKEILSSKEFYDKFISTSSFILFPEAMYQSENFLQKSDGSFRDSSLISPMLYLIIQAVGREIYNKYIPERQSDISAYYAGNYEYLRPKYKQDYDDFFKELNSCIDEYQYFIKTDITNFFSNISIDKLIVQIDKICNNNKVAFSQTQLYLYKELLTYCGNGRFPLIENSIASSYLATIIYLDTVDVELYGYLTSNVPVISSFRMVRYVDDLYILIATDKPFDTLKKAYNEVRNEYSSILKKHGLSLNTRKCCIKKTSEINYELKKSLYDEYFNGEKHNIEELFQGSLLEFLKDLSLKLLSDSIDVEKYNELIDAHFSSEDIEFTPSEVFNYYVYERNTELQRDEVVEEIVGLVKQSISFISLDPKRLTVLVMKTKSDKAIKAFLKQLFKRNRANKWNTYDTTIAISYLIQSEFKHIDLLDIISSQESSLYHYYFYNCKNGFLNYLNFQKNNDLISIIGNDSKAHFLYFMYLCENKKGNYLAAFAYYKNFFDRITADLDFVFNPDSQNKKPRYKRFYEEKVFKSFYKEIPNSEQIIKKAHILRNANPISHSSSELVDNDDTSDELNQCVDDLSNLIFEYIKTHLNQIHTLS